MEKYRRASSSLITAVSINPDLILEIAAFLTSPSSFDSFELAISPEISPPTRITTIIIINQLKPFFVT